MQMACYVNRFRVTFLADEFIDYLDIVLGPRSLATRSRLVRMSKFCELSLVRGGAGHYELTWGPVESLAL